MTEFLFLFIRLFLHTCFLNCFKRDWKLTFHYEPIDEIAIAPMTRQIRARLSEMLIQINFSINCFSHNCMFLRSTLSFITTAANKIVSVTPDIRTKRRHSFPKYLSPKSEGTMNFNEDRILLASRCNRRYSLASTDGWKEGFFIVGRCKRWGTRRQVCCWV